MTPEESRRLLFLGYDSLQTPEQYQQAFLAWSDSSGISYHSIDFASKVAGRAVSMGLSSPAALGSASRDEALALWTSNDGLHTELCAPGLSRAQFLTWHLEANRQSTLSVSRQLGFESLGPVGQPSLQASADFSPLISGLSHLTSGLSKVLDSRKKRRKLDVGGDSDSEDLGDFDLPNALSSLCLRPEDRWAFNIQCFADSKRLAVLHKAASSARAKGLHFVAQSGFEQWNPSWVGQGFSPEARKTMSTSRSKSVAFSAASFISNLSVFWLSHMAIGVVSLPAVLAHIVTMSRLVEEESLSYAVSYEHRLQLHLSDEHRAGRWVDVSRDISGILDYLRRDLENSEKRRASRSHVSAPFLVSDAAPRSRPVLLQKEKARARNPLKVQRARRVQGLLCPSWPCPLQALLAVRRSAWCMTPLKARPAPRRIVSQSIWTLARLPSQRGFLGPAPPLRQPGLAGPRRARRPPARPLAKGGAATLRPHPQLSPVQSPPQSRRFQVLRLVPSLQLPHLEIPRFHLPLSKDPHRPMIPFFGSCWTSLPA